MYVRVGGVGRTVSACERASVCSVGGDGMCRRALLMRASATSVVKLHTRWHPSTGVFGKGGNAYGCVYTSVRDIPPPCMGQASGRQSKPLRSFGEASLRCAGRRHGNGLQAGRGTREQAYPFLLLGTLGRGAVVFVESETAAVALAADSNRAFLDRRLGAHGGGCERDFGRSERAPCPANLFFFFVYLPSHSPLASVATG